MGRQPRQRPISCHLCRVRKLRCSRQFPCSNCTSRGVVCQHEGISVTPAAAGGQPQLKSPTLKDTSTTELLARLERLESLVASQGTERGETPKRENSKNGAEKSAQQSPATTVSRPVPPRLQRLTADALQLERSCSDHMLTVSLCFPFQRDCLPLP
jgi:hypothetical protein